MLLDKKNLVDRLIMLCQRTYATADEHVAFLQVRQKGRCINKIADFCCLNDQIFTRLFAEQLPDKLHRKE